jgi:hypothetical protein
MPRTLSVARVRVPLPKQAEWLETVEQLAARLRTKGQRFWVFQSESDNDLWLEFSESHDRASHRHVNKPSAEEHELDQKLKSLAKYDKDATALWVELSLTKES